MMAMETTVTKDGVTCKPLEGTPEENKELEKSYEHLCKLRDEVIEMGVLPLSPTGTDSTPIYDNDETIYINKEAV